MTASERRPPKGGEPGRDTPPPGGTASEVFRAFLVLGLTSFGGPIAHLGFFRTEFVERRRWLDDRAYAEVVTFCSLLPGPTSSQVGLTIGLGRAGPGGALAAWLGFTLPSAVALTLLGLGIAPLLAAAGSGWLRGLEAAAAAVVALAAITMARTLTPDLPRACIAIVSAAIALLLPPVLGQVAAIGFGAMAGLVLPAGTRSEARPAAPVAIPFLVSVGALVAFAALLAGLPVAARLSGSLGLGVADSFFRAGSLVFGGGHVVLPLLQAEVVPRGWIAIEPFMAGYAATQATPGPLFTFAAYLGALMPAPIGGVGGALLAIVAIFAPSFLLVAGLLPAWSRLQALPRANAILRGTNAAVVGLVFAALYHPIWTEAIRDATDVLVMASAFMLLAGTRAPPWLVILLAGVVGALLLGVFTI